MPEVLFQLSGSIAAYKACHVVSRLVQAGCAVQTVATRAALEFVGPATLEGLTGRAVAADTFAAGSHMDHIHLVRRADLIVLCPATANTINRLAAGIADDLIGTMFLAFDFRVPYIVVPAMNAAMYEHPATAAALDRLTGWGVEVIQPSAGALACGEIGPGRLAEPDDIVANLLGRLGV
ncbi:MAG TPA: flavoprotein, partial [Desertimonas sp.]|nr:flavoprotein [Desertimonas sp.]